MTRQAIGQALGAHLTRIEAMLPAECRLTLVVRNTGQSDADIVIGNDDDLESTIRAIANLKETGSDDIDIRIIGGRAEATRPIEAGHECGCVERDDVGHVDEPPTDGSVPE